MGANRIPAPSVKEEIMMDKPDYSLAASVAEYLDGRAQVTISELARGVLSIEQPGTADQRRLAIVIERTGWIRGQRTKTARYWTRPADGDAPRTGEGDAFQGPSSAGDAPDQAPQIKVTHLVADKPLSLEDRIAAAVAASKIEPAAPGGCMLNIRDGKGVYRACNRPVGSGGMFCRDHA